MCHSDEDEARAFHYRCAPYYELVKAAAIGVVAARDGVKFVSQSALGRSAIQKVAQVSLGKAVYGAAAFNHVAKLLRTNAVTGAVTTAVISGPDFYRATFSRNISWAQFGKNLAVSGASVAGGAGGWMAGAAGGAAVGSVVPVIGTAAGGVIGGILGRWQVALRRVWRPNSCLMGWWRTMPRRCSACFLAM